MKVVIPSKGRADIICSHLLFPDAYVVVHNEEEAKEYRKNKIKNLVVSNTPYGISFQRQWIIDNLIDKDEWFLTADDNIEYFTGVEEPFYSKELASIKEHFDSRISIDRAWEIINDTMNKSEELGVKYAGFATNPNWYFRDKKFRYVGYVISKLALIKKSNIPYDPKIQAMDDYGYTAENLLRFGKVLINNYLFPMGKHYQKGGIGTYKERSPKKREDCIYLMNKYPDLFRYKIKSGCDPKAELQVRFSNLKQVNLWRKKILKLA